MKPVSQWTDNWVASGPRATTAYKEGVQNTSKDWAGLTRAAIPRMVAGFNEAANNGTIERGISAAGTGYWQTQTVNKSQNFSNGLTQGRDNYAAAAAKLDQALRAGIAGLPARGDIETNFARSRALGLYLHDRKGTLGAR